MRPAAARGFTLIETMIVVTILGVLMVAALPAFTQFMRDQRVKTASFELISTLTLARSEALTRNSAVTITPTSASNWASGWQVTSGTLVLRSQDAFPDITITKVSGPTTVSYSGSGRLTDTSGGQLKLQLGATGGAVATRCVTVDLTGRPVSKMSACS